MQTYARAFPVKSKEDVLAFGRAIDAWPAASKAAFVARFEAGCERWYLQDIAGKPHVISVIEAARLEDGFREFAQATDEFSVWFRGQVQRLTGVDLAKSPSGPNAELVYELRLS